MKVGEKRRPNAGAELVEEMAVLAVEAEVGFGTQTGRNTTSSIRERV
jgi:hypothetical protein